MRTTFIDHGPDRPLSVAELIVNAVLEDIRERAGGSAFLDGMDLDVLHDELLPELTQVVTRVLAHGRAATVQDTRAAVRPAVPTCLTCKHVVDPSGQLPMCASPAILADPVTGALDVTVPCRSLRYPDAMCGRYGHFWEPKDESQG